MGQGSSLDAGLIGARGKRPLCVEGARPTRRRSGAEPWSTLNDTPPAVPVLCLVVLRPFGPLAHAGIVAAPGYAVHTIATPGTVQGGVVWRGAAILVGQGAFGVGSESIIRLDGTATTVATGFNSLGGFDIDASGTLYVVDNGGAQAGAATGDTLFTIPEALTRLDAVTAVGHEVVPKGTIPFAQDVLLTPDGAVLVSAAVGPGGWPRGPSARWHGDGPDHGPRLRRRPGAPARRNTARGRCGRYLHGDGLHLSFRWNPARNSHEWYRGSGQGHAGARSVS
jgi:hypothetical protein